MSTRAKCIRKSYFEQHSQMSPWYFAERRYCGIIIVAEMEKAQQKFVSKSSIKMRSCASDTLAFRKIRLAVAAIDGGAKQMGISGREMYERLSRLGLVHNRLIGDYEQLHTQSERWVVEDTVETLKNWEARE